jgi:hypothetical protein
MELQNVALQQVPKCNIFPEFLYSYGADSIASRHINGQHIISICYSLVKSLV